MNFDPEKFLLDFRRGLDVTVDRAPVAKTYNADDTLRVFEAADKACEEQPEYFPVNGESRWNGKKVMTNEGKERAVREFLCDYTYHDSKGRILLSLESEWGVLASPHQTTAAVIFDFKKIINMGSSVKIMVFAYVSERNEEESLEEMASIIRPWSQDVLGTLMAISCTWHDALCGETIKGYLWNQEHWEGML